MKQTLRTNNIINYLINNSYNTEIVKFDVLNFEFVISKFKCYIYINKGIWNYLYHVLKMTNYFEKWCILNGKEYKQILVFIRIL